MGSIPFDVAAAGGEAGDVTAGEVEHLGDAQPTVAHVGVFVGVEVTEHGCGLLGEAEVFDELGEGFAFGGDAHGCRLVHIGLLREARILVGALGGLGRGLGNGTGFTAWGLGGSGQSMARGGRGVGVMVVYGMGVGTCSWSLMGAVAWTGGGIGSGLRPVK